MENPANERKNTHYRTSHCVRCSGCLHLGIQNTPGELPKKHVFLPVAMCRSPDVGLGLCAAIIAVHVVITVIAVTALTLRFSTFGEIRHEVTPGDMLLLNKPCKHTFCSSMGVSTWSQTMVESGLLKDILDHPSYMFDVYLLPSVPPIDQSKRRITQYDMKEILNPGGYVHQSFSLLAGTIMTFDPKPAKLLRNVDDVLVGEDDIFLEETDQSYWFYLIKSQNNFSTWKKHHLNLDVDCDASFCLHSQQVGQSELNTKHKYTYHALSTDEYYAVFSIPRHMGLLHRNKYLISSDITVNRSLYTVPADKKPLCQKVRNCSSSATGLLLLDLAYYVPEVRTVSVLYVCNPNVVTYLGLFCATPLVLGILLCCIVYLCGRFGSERDDLLLNNNGPSINKYGSTRRRQALLHIIKGNHTRA